MSELFVEEGTIAGGPLRHGRIRSAVPSRRSGGTLFNGRDSRCQCAAAKGDIGPDEGCPVRAGGTAQTIVKPGYDTYHGGETERGRRIKGLAGV
jgi:hypothetical protein